MLLFDINLLYLQNYISIYLYMLGYKINNYGKFTDEPPDSEWFTRFDVLSLPEDHRKILNRQPVMRFFSFSNGMSFAVILIDSKVLSN